MDLIDDSKFRLIIEKLDIHYKENNKDYLLCQSVCHNSNSYKLHAYWNSKSFYCHKESKRFSLYSMVMLIKHISFVESLEWICDICGIEYSRTQRITKKTNNIDDWEESLSKYIRIENKYNELQIFDDSILNFFDNTIHQDWLDFGISLETLFKYRIGYYNYQQQITIPVYDQYFNLVGIRCRNMNPNSNIKYIPLCMLNGDSYKFPINQCLYGLNFTQNAIRKHKKVFIVEAEKSQLKMDTWFGEENCCACMMGSSLGKNRRDLLLSLGIEVVILIVDRDIKAEHELEEGEILNEKEIDDWYRKIQREIDLWKGLCKVEVMWDNEFEYDYKSNACDYDLETFNKFYENREIVEN